MRIFVFRLTALLVGLVSASAVLAQNFATPTPLTEGPIALITLGDSLTEGAEDSLELGGYPGRLLTLINDVRPGSTLTNLGHSGWSSLALIDGDQGLPSELDEALQAITAAKSAGQVPVVLVWIGSNDLFYLYEYGDPSAGNQLEDTFQFSANIYKILEPLRDAGALVGIALLDDQSKRPVTTGGLAFTGISPAEITAMSAQVVEYNKIIYAKASQFGAFLVDFYNTTIFTDAATLADDGNHPNPAGYDIIAERWYEALLPILSSDAAPLATPSIPYSLTPAATAAPVEVTITAGEIALITLGDSLTEGAEDSLELGGYPGRLLTLINEVRPGATLLNLGHSGWSSDALINGDQGLRAELDEALEAITAAKSAGQVPVALVWIGSNDLFYLYEYDSPDEAGETADADHFGANLDVILSALHDAGATIGIALLDDQSKRPVTTGGLAFTGIAPAEITAMSAQVARYNEIIMAKAAEYGAFTVDFYNTTIFTDAATLADDGNHPNPAGYDLIAERWFAALEPALQGE